MSQTLAAVVPASSFVAPVVPVSPNWPLYNPTAWYWVIGGSTSQVYS